MISALREDEFTESASLGRPVTVRKAVMRDIRPILDLINGYAARGVMLPRTEFELSEAIRDFSVVVRNDQLLGCGALHFYTPTLGEIRSLAVQTGSQDAGRGTQADLCAGATGAGVRTGRRFRVHLRGGVLPQSGLSGGGARRSAPQSLERLRALPEISGLRRDRRVARAAQEPMAGGATGTMGRAEPGRWLHPDSHAGGVDRAS